MTDFLGVAIDPNASRVPDDAGCTGTAGVASSRIVCVQLEKTQGRRGPTYVMDGFCGRKVFGKEGVEEVSGCGGDLLENGVEIEV